MDNAVDESTPLMHERSFRYRNTETYAQGVPSTRPLTVTTSGRRQHCGDIKKAEWALMIFAVLSTLVMAGFSIHRIVVLESSTNRDQISPIIVKLILEAFAIYYICHGVVFERYQEIAIYCLAILCDDAYCTYEFLYKGDFSLFPKLCSVIFIWTEKHERPMNVEDICVLVLGGVVNFAFFCTGKLAIRREEHRGTFFFLILGAFPYFFLLYKIAKQIDGIRAGFYLDVASMLFGSLSVVCRTFILGLSYLITARYGKGLGRIFEDPENVGSSASRDGARNDSAINNS